MTYVYLHEANVPERSSNLIFRYIGDDPKIVWTGAEQFRVSVDGARDIGKQVVKLGGITTNYRIIPIPQNQ